MLNFNQYLFESDHFNLNLDIIHHNILKNLKKYYDIPDDNNNLDKLKDNYENNYIFINARKIFSELDINQIYKKYIDTEPTEKILKNSKTYNKLFEKWYKDNIAALFREYPFDSYIDDKYYNVRHLAEELSLNNTNLKKPYQQ